jgi:hypothetical protein
MRQKLHRRVLGTNVNCTGNPLNVKHSGPAVGYSANIFRFICSGRRVYKKQNTKSGWQWVTNSSFWLNNKYIQHPTCAPVIK